MEVPMSAGFYVREDRSRSRGRRSSSRTRSRSRNRHRGHHNSSTEDSQENERSHRRRRSRSRSHGSDKAAKRKRHKKEKKSKRNRRDHRRTDSRSPSARRHRGRSTSSSWSRSSTRNWSGARTTTRADRHDSDSEREEMPSKMTADPPAQVSTELQGAGQDITLTQLPREIYMEIADHEKSTADSLNLTGAPEAPKISKSDFFAQLRMQESRRGVVGTVHAKGKSSGPGVTGGAPGTAPSQDWTCPKCGASNYKHFNECQKCHALKRLTTYR